MLGGLLICLVIAGVIGAVGYRYFLGDDGRIDESALILAEATRGPFDHIVLEQGEIESSSNVEVVCQVESKRYGGIEILWAIPEGTRVKPGDKLVELDASSLEQREKEQRILVITGESAVTSAEAVLEQAKISREEYLQGTFVQEEKVIQGEINVAEQDLRKAELALRSSERLVAKGLVKSLQLEADRYAVANAQTQVDAKQNQLDVLRNLTKRKMLVQFDSDIEAAQVQLTAAEAELLEEQIDLQEVQDQIAKCTLYAPTAGVVVHANQFSMRGGNAEFVVEPGAAVRDRQAIIRLPDPSKMQIKCKVNESRITLIDQGMPVKISVDAIPGLELKGRVTKVNQYAEAGNMWGGGNSIKEYATFVEIIDPPTSIRTGMTAECQIFVQQLEDVVQIPIQALYDHGGEMYTLIQRGDKFVTSKVEIQATNDVAASISKGVEANDRVVLNLRKHLDLMDLPEIERQDNSEFREMRDADLANRPSQPDGPAGEPAAGGRPDAGSVGAQGNWAGGEGAGRGPGGAAGRGGPGGPGRGGPGGPGRGGPGGPGRGGPGGPGRGGPGGGMPPVAEMVSRMMEGMDTDGDGKLSQEEFGANPMASRLSGADADGDGAITKAELTKALNGMRKQFPGGGS